MPAFAGSSPVRRGWEISGANFGRLVAQGYVRGGQNPSRDLADAFDDAAIVLETTVEAVAATDRSWPAKVTAVLYGVLEFFVSDPEEAQLLMVDASSSGPYGALRRERLIEYFSVALATGRRERREVGELPLFMEQVLVGGVAWTITREIEMGRTKELARLFPELVEFLLLPYLGSAAAGKWGQCAAAAAAEARVRRI